MPAQAEVWMMADPGHHDADPWFGRLLYNTDAHLSSALYPSEHTGTASSVASTSDESSSSVADPARSLQQRLDNVNSHFRRKATEVFADDVALGLLAVLYQDSVIDLADFNACELGVPLAKLTAANFCEVGANVIYITESGQRFIASIQNHE